MAATVAVDPHAASRARAGRAAGDLRRTVVAAPRPSGSRTRTAGSTRRGLGWRGRCRRYRFSVKEKGTAYVYVGDQWYDLNLGLYSMKTGVEVGCWSVQVKGTSVESERRKLGFVRPDERAIEVEAGDYLLTARAS